MLSLHGDPFRIQTTALWGHTELYLSKHESLLLERQLHHDCKGQDLIHRPEAVCRMGFHYAELNHGFANLWQNAVLCNLKLRLIFMSVIRILKYVNKLIFPVIWS